MKLSELYPILSTKERELLAEKAGADAGYLWQLSKRWRGKKPSLSLIQALSAADERLTLSEMVEEFTEVADKTEQGA